MEYEEQLALCQKRAFEGAERARRRLESTTSLTVAEIIMAEAAIAQVYATLCVNGAINTASAASLSRV